MAEPAFALPSFPARDDEEAERLAALRRYAILDTPPDAAFDDVARLAAQICGTPMAVISLVDEKRQWFKSAVGLDLRETPLDLSFCARLMREPGVCAVPDAALDSRFARNPLVTGPPGLRFYAGAQLLTPEGQPLGMLGVLDTRPRALTPEQAFALRTLAGQVMAQLELRRALRERGAALDEARTGEARFRGMAEEAPFVIWVTDRDNRCTYHNRAWTALTGQAGNRALGFGWLDAVHPDDVAATAETMARAGERREPFRLDYRLRRADGAWRWAINAATPLLGPDGGFEGHVGSVVDITERKQAEDALRALTAGLERAVDERTAELDQERARLRAALSDMPLGVVMVSAHAGGAGAGALGYCNPAARDLAEGDCGLLLRAADGDDGPGFLRADGTPLPPAEHPAARALRLGEPVGPEEVLFRRPGGGTVLASVRCAPVRGTPGGAAGLAVLVVEDVSARRRTEDALRQAQKMEAVGQLTGGIAHDFNNLLTGIVGSLELMRRRIDAGRSGEVGRYVQGAVQSAERAAALTHRLLAFARRQPLDPRPVDVNALVRAMEGLLRRTLGEAVELELRLLPDLWPTLCDPNQLENALLNLALNAREAMPGGGRLRMETLNLASAGGSGAERVAVRVSDTGRGMSAEVASRAFDPFFTTKPLGQGTGLSLSMIYGFAEQSGGQVRLRSAPGQGTAVELELPRHRPAVAEGAAPPGGGTPVPAPEKGVILVVEDQQVVRDVVVEVLREMGYRVLEAGDGPAGLAALRGEGSVDLLVTDVGLPGGLNGRQVADLARAERPGLKVLFVTGYAENAFGPGALAAGMELLTKPFSVDALAERLRAMIGLDHAGR